MTSRTAAKAEMWAFINTLADQLGETERGPRSQIARIVRGVGVEFARELYQRTLETEGQGGLMLPDGSRRRTVGGVFIYLARAQVSSELRLKIFPPRRKKSQKAVRQSPSASAARPPLLWNERAEVIETLRAQSGAIHSLKVVLIGRPERLEQTEEQVTLWIADSVDQVTLPRGVPTPPSGTTVYKVYLGIKHWKRVEGALVNPEDQLIIEGVATFDTAIQAMVVYATRASSQLLEAQRRTERLSILT